MSERTRDSRTRQRAARLARSRRGTLVVAGWAFAEAVSWPVLPEVALAALCVADPRSGPRLSVAAAAGSVAGRAVTRALAARGVTPPRPLTTPRMRSTVTAQIAAEGARGVRHQPLAGIPYKVYAVEAGRQGVDPSAFVRASARARGARILAAGLALTAFGAAFRDQRRHYGRYLTVVTGGFTVALAAIVRGWSR